MICSVLISSFFQLDHQNWRTTFFLSKVKLKAITKSKPTSDSEHTTIFTHLSQEKPSFFKNSGYNSTASMWSKSSSCTPTPNLADFLHELRVQRFTIQQHSIIVLRSLILLLVLHLQVTARLIAVMCVKLCKMIRSWTWVGVVPPLGWTQVWEEYAVEPATILHTCSCSSNITYSQHNSQQELSLRLCVWTHFPK